MAATDPPCLEDASATDNGWVTPQPPLLTGGTLVFGSHQAFDCPHEPRQPRMVLWSRPEPTLVVCCDACVPIARIALVFGMAEVKGSVVDLQDAIEYGMVTLLHGYGSVRSLWVEEVPP